MKKKVLFAVYEKNNILTYNKMRIYRRSLKISEAITEVLL
jgi:hypothetical protein